MTTQEITNVAYAMALAGTGIGLAASKITYQFMKGIAQGKRELAKADTDSLAEHERVYASGLTRKLDDMTHERDRLAEELARVWTLLDRGAFAMNRNGQIVTKTPDPDKDKKP